jgi:hypothetical protein
MCDGFFGSSLMPSPDLIQFRASRSLPLALQIFVKFSVAFGFFDGGEFRSNRVCCGGHRPCNRLADFVVEFVAHAVILAADRVVLLRSLLFPLTGNEAYCCNNGKHNGSDNQ